MKGKDFTCKSVGHVKFSWKVKLKLSSLISDVNYIDNLCNALSCDLNRNDFACKDLVA